MPRSLMRAHSARHRAAAYIQRQAAARLLMVVMSRRPSSRPVTLPRLHDAGCEPSGCGRDETKLVCKDASQLLHKTFCRAPALALTVMDHAQQLPKTLLASQYFESAVSTLR